MNCASPMCFNSASPNSFVAPGRFVPIRSAPRRVALLLLLVAASTPLTESRAAQQSAPAHAANAPIACRVMERHADKERGIVLILFHQRDKPDQPKLKDFLLQHDGGSIEIQIGSGEWQKVTVWRIRNCFGRGLFAISDTAAAPKEKSIFKIRAQ
jgi:hypothetical protein